MSVDAFTSDVDWGSVGQGALVGGVVGLTSGLGTAYLGAAVGTAGLTGSAATAAGVEVTAVSGVMAGQMGRVTQNWLDGVALNTGLVHRPVLNFGIDGSISPNF